MVKCALVYWGLTRSTKRIYLTHKKFLHDELDKLNIEYDVFFHSWKLEDNEKQCIWNNKCDVEIDYEEYKYLKPDKYELNYKIERQKDFSDTIIIDKYHLCGKWKYYFVNHLCACESLKRSFKMIPKNEYKYVIFLRPDQKICRTIDFESIFSYLDNNIKGICLPKNHSFLGYCDRFCVMNYCDANIYANRIDEFHLYKPIKGKNGLTSEMIIQILVDTHELKVKQFAIGIKLVRPKKEVEQK